MRGGAAAIPAHTWTICTRYCRPVGYITDPSLDVATAQQLRHIMLHGRISPRLCGLPLLPAGCGGIGFRVVHRYAVIQLGNAERDVCDQIGDPRHVLVVDVFRLVGPLWVVV